MITDLLNIKWDKCQKISRLVVNGVPIEKEPMLIKMNRTINGVLIILKKDFHIKYLMGNGVSKKW